MAEEAERPVDNLSFEEALAELEAIVKQLEGGTATLDNSITLYERGAALKARCEDRLKQAQMRVEQIVDTGSTVTTKSAEYSG